MVESMFNQIKFSDKDIVNLDAWIAGDDGYNPHRVRPFLFHESGFTVGIVFASSIQDALDELADSGRIDHLKVEYGDPDYAGESDSKGRVDEDTWGESLHHLGNASEPFDIEGLSVIELPNPTRSFCAQFNADQEARKI